MKTQRDCFPLRPFRGSFPPPHLPSSRIFPLLLLRRSLPRRCCSRCRYKTENAVRNCPNLRRRSRNPPYREAPAIAAAAAAAVASVSLADAVDADSTRHSKDVWMKRRSTAHWNSGSSEEKISTRKCGDDMEYNRYYAN